MKIKKCLKHKLKGQWLNEIGERMYVLGDDDCINLKCVMRESAELKDFILFDLQQNGCITVPRSLNDYLVSVTNAVL